MTLTAFQDSLPATTTEAEGATWTWRDTDPQGEAVPLVMLPGAGGNGDVFYRVADSLRASRRVLTVAYPALDDAERLASGLLSALTAAGIQRFDVLGSSLGGYVAQVCALSRPVRVRRCMLASTFFDPAWMKRRISRADLQQTPAESQLAKSIRQIEAVADDDAEKADYKRTMLALLGHDQTAAMAKAALLAVLGASALPRLDLPASDLAVLDCEDDMTVDGPTRQALRDRYGGSPQFHLASGGHYPALLNPADFIAAARRHFTEPGL